MKILDAVPKRFLQERNHELVVQEGGKMPSSCLGENSLIREVSFLRCLENGHGVLEQDKVKSFGISGFLENPEKMKFKILGSARAPEMMNFLTFAQ